MNTTQMPVKTRLEKLSDRMIRKAVFLRFTKEDAKDFSQESLLKSISSLSQDKDIETLILEDPLYFENYTFKVLYRQIQNRWRENANRRPPGFDQTKHNVRPKPQKPTFNGKNFGYPGDDEDEEILTPNHGPDQETNLIKKEDQKMTDEFLNKLKPDLLDDELNFIKYYIEMAEESDKVIVDTLSKKLGLQTTKANDILKRIRRKALSLQSMHHIIKQAAISGGPFASMMWSLFRSDADSESIDPFAARCAQEVIGQLSPRELKFLSKVL